MRTSIVKRLSTLTPLFILVAIFILFPSTTLAIGPSAAGGHLDTFHPKNWSLQLKTPTFNLHETTFDARYARMIIVPDDTMASTHGNIATTIYAKKLPPNVTYTLTDNNSSCMDSINVGAAISSDQNGNFAYPIAGGPFYFTGSTPCVPGKYTVTMTPTAGTSLTTSFTIKPPYRSHLEGAFVFPAVVQLTTSGEFATSLYVRGLPANKSYRFSDNINCTDDINSAAPLDINVDGNGNGNIVLFGGPAFFSGPLCHAGRFAVTLEDLTSGTLYTAKFIILPSHT